MTNPTKFEQESERKFDEQFGEDTDQLVGAHTGWIQKELKSFIHSRTRLAAERERKRLVQDLETHYIVKYGEHSKEHLLVCEWLEIVSDEEVKEILTSLTQEEKENI